MYWVSIDPGTEMGVAWWKDKELIDVEYVNLKNNKKEVKHEEQIKNLRLWISKNITTKNTKLVVLEYPVTFSNKNKGDAPFKQGEKLRVLKDITDFVTYSPNTAKSALTGKGNADKDLMVLNFEFRFKDFCEKINYDKKTKVAKRAIADAVGIGLCHHQFI